VAVIEPEVPIAMRKLYRRLERWRSNRKGQSPIPEPLWTAAGELAREHGVNPVSRVLRLEFNHLKRAAQSGSAEAPQATGTIDVCGTGRATNGRRGTPIRNRSGRTAG
jgi:hypothetical protein